MSAICGILLTDGGELGGALLDRQLRSLDHRGLDGRATWREGQIGFGHQMLHVTPESLTEALPWHDRASGLAITADARLDNREDLFRTLSITGPKRHLIPDSSVILKAYERWGEDCARHLLGDFAFAIWDGRKRELFCATDAMGLRPLFYYSGPGLFAFASEIRALHA
ncbi:MAG: asparagine synthetase B, partial [Alphaproteobacteria bacterium]